MSMLPLWRNRDFVLLETGRLLTTTGTQLTIIAYPLLVLATTGSPSQAGLVTAARLIPYGIFGLFAGVAADRWNRKRLMVLTDCIRALAVASLAGAILADSLTFAQILIVAFVEGTGAVFFSGAVAAALRSVVPLPQLPTAAGAQQARASVVQLVGPPVGGALFQLGRAVPFLVDVVSYACSIVSLLLMRSRFQEEREAEESPLRSQIAEGFRFLWDRPFLRTCAFIYAIGNFAMPGLLFVIVVSGTQQGLTGGEIGLLIAVFGACVLAGSLLSPLARRRFSMRTIILIEQWTWIGTAAFVIWPNVYVLTAAILPFALVAPSTDSVLDGYRIAVTPDRLVGRVETVRTSIALLIAPFGPFLAGVLLESSSLRVTGAVFAACGIALAVWATLSQSIRAAPSLAELDELAVAR